MPSDSRTLAFQRGSETWTLDVEFSVQGADSSVGDAWPRAYISAVEYLNPNTRRWTPFALSAAEFAWVESQVQP